MLVVLEGIDGAGTTTQAARLVTALNAAGHPTHGTREPSQGPVGRLLREMLAGQHAPVDAATMSLLFAADRADHLAREIEVALLRGQIVVSDSYYHSSLAYQGADEDREWIANLNANARQPDVTFLLDVDVDLAAKRRADAGRPRGALRSPGDAAQGGRELSAPPPPAAGREHHRPRWIA